jgi:ornithine decarboxylase
MFRYKVKLPEVKVGDKIIFLNAGAYNFSTNFCRLNELKTEIV